MPCEVRRVPRISAFRGIVIRMFYDDHLPPHFHADYAEHGAVIALGNFRVLRGSLPSRQMSLVRRWAALHQEELLDNWNRARDYQDLTPIDPLP
jgi:hypothetical protein